MAIDPTKLTRSELLQIINATPLGEALTRSRLRRQMDVAALKIGDGKRIHIVRYVRWLVDEVEKPRPAKMSYAELRRRQVEKNREATKSIQDIAPIPQIEDYQRRKAAGESFRLFCETYFPTAFWRPWSQDHLRVIAKIEKAVREGGLFAFAMPRGSGKTTLARCAALWAVLYGYRPFVCLIGAADDRAKELLLPIRKHILENPLLLEDFPESIYPLRALENSSKRQLQQHCRGQLTHVHWGLNKLVFPNIEGEDIPVALRQDGFDQSPSSGSIITTTSLDANMRGQQHTRVDGSILRPSLVLLDDPQTRDSARSAEQTNKRTELLNGDVLGMAGPGESISALMTCTKMYDGDLADTVLDVNKCPEWDSECTRLVYSFPSNEKLWDEYFEVRRTKGKAAANEFYAARQAAMDAGASIAWEARYDAKSGELSAIQHAMNLRKRVGPDAFAAEYQNEPVEHQEDADRLTVEAVLAKYNGRKRNTVPTQANKITMFIDVHKRLLFYCVCAWQDDFTGYVIDYGTYPDQKRSHFTAAKPRRSMPGESEEAAIAAGVEELISQAMKAEYRRDDGVSMKVDRICIDKNYQPEAIETALRRLGVPANVWMARGVSVTASKKPFSEYVRKPGQKLGYHWMIPSLRGTQRGTLRYVANDVNYWKTFVHDRLRVDPGGPGGLSLFGDKRTNHQMFAEHIAKSETSRLVEDKLSGREVNEWSPLPTRPDNHWFDCLVGCAAAASQEGIVLAGGVGSANPIRRRVATVPKRKRR